MHKLQRQTLDKIEIFNKSISILQNFFKRKKMNFPQKQYYLEERLQILRKLRSLVKLMLFNKI